GSKRFRPHKLFRCACQRSSPQLPPSASPFSYRDLPLNFRHEFLHLLCGSSDISLHHLRRDTHFKSQLTLRSVEVRQLHREDFSLSAGDPVRCTDGLERRTDEHSVLNLLLSAVLVVIYTINDEQRFRIAVRCEDREGLDR